jgi:nucleotide-binding universal stress UspA family protein
MPNVLLVIPDGAEPLRAMAAAIDLAKARRGRLVALIVLDPAQASRVTRTLSEEGFISEAVGTQVGATITNEHRSDAGALLQALCERARKDGVVVTPLIEEGDAGEICDRVIRAHHIGTAVLVAEKRSWLTRFLSRDVVVQVATLSGCEVKMMEED